MPVKYPILPKPRTTKTATKSSKRVRVFGKREATAVAEATSLLSKHGFRLCCLDAGGGSVRVIASLGKHPKLKALDKLVASVEKESGSIRVPAERPTIVADQTPDPVYPKRHAVEIEIDKQLRADTGALKSTDPLVSFIYHLLRDQLPAGVVEQQVMNAIKNADALYSNGFLLQYAENIAKRLVCK